MDMTGEYLIAAPRQKVWDALNDPNILKQCIAGCQELLKTSPTSFTATVQARVGPVSARFGGKVNLVDLDPPNGYRIVGEGTGGAAGFAKGGATVKLSDGGPGQTKLAYAVDAHVGGKLAQIGSRLIDSTARKMADEFFAKFAGLVGAGNAASMDAAAPAMPAAAAPGESADPAMRHGTPPVTMPGEMPSQSRLSADATETNYGLPPMVWVVVLAAAVAAVLYYFTR
jgi:carbon monoxide dehydrogenase subunit G